MISVISQKMIIGVFVSTMRMVSTTSSIRRKHAFIALGSNVGDRASSLAIAFRHLKALGDISGSSFLYETPPQYYTHQPPFLNAVCRIETDLLPPELLKALKSLEEKIGREKSFRYGPRAIDLDILFYGNDLINTEQLQIPHPRLHERAFVLQPLCDIDSHLIHPILGISVGQLLDMLPKESLASIRKVLPLGKKDGMSRLFDVSEQGQCIIMGILNATPDSFSDGGKLTSIKDTVNAVKRMVAEGADIIDIGGASSRPGALTISIEEELQRTIPVINAIRDEGLDICLSIDTNQSIVADAAIEAGADVINDISGGLHDPNMFQIAHKHDIPMILMHMRGNPQNMTTLVAYEDVVTDVAKELNEQLQLVDEWIPKWNQIVDPGIGFAKTPSQSTALLNPTNLKTLRSLLGSRTMLVGVSRKGFIGRITGVEVASERDWGTAGASCAAIAGGAEIIRVHNVYGLKQACSAMKAILLSK